jgi:hypothetical protein
MQSALDTVEGSRCGQSIACMQAIDWPHREWLIGASAGCRNQKLIILSFRLSTIAEQVSFTALEGGQFDPPLILVDSAGAGGTMGALPP